MSQIRVFKLWLQLALEACSPVSHRLAADCRRRPSPGTYVTCLPSSLAAWRQLNCRAPSMSRCSIAKRSRVRETDVVEHGHLTCAAALESRPPSRAASPPFQNGLAAARRSADEEFLGGPVPVKGARGLSSALLMAAHSITQLPKCFIRLPGLGPRDGMRADAAGRLTLAAKVPGAYDTRTRGGDQASLA